MPSTRGRLDRVRADTTAINTPYAKDYYVGLDTNGVKFLLYCNHVGVDFSRTAMIGRQNLHLNKQELLRLMLSFNHQLTDSQMESILSSGSGFAEPFLARLGGKTIHSFDKSDFENATDLHDMNLEIPEKYKGKYSMVLDAGSLEHVFNFPVAIKNCMEMVCLGGHFLSITPMNNFVGHGFYQFSPELFFSVFTQNNGFELVHLLAIEDRPNAKWYSVKSPIQLKRRVTLCNSVQSYLLVMARKVADANIFRSQPQQSDYVAVWENEESGRTMTPEIPISGDSTNKKSFAILKAVMPRPVKRFAKEILKTLYPEQYSNITDPEFSTPFFSDPKNGPPVNG